MQTAWLILGSNIGNKNQNLNLAIDKIHATCGSIANKSSVYETKSWGYEDENYFNQAVEIKTLLKPKELLFQLLKIESAMGRKRNFSQNYEARIIDIDIVFYEDKIVEEKELTIPHLQIENRKFVLLPLNELIPNFIHPKLNTTISYLLKTTKDKLKVEKLK
jgi:deoxyguanosine kinase